MSEPRTKAGKALREHRCWQADPDASVADWERQVDAAIAAGPCQNCTDRREREAVLYRVIAATEGQIAALRSEVARWKGNHMIGALRQKATALVNECYQVYHTRSSEAGPEEWDSRTFAPSTETVEALLRVLSDTASAATEEVARIEKPWREALQELLGSLTANLVFEDANQRFHDAVDVALALLSDGE